MRRIIAALALTTIPMLAGCGGTPPEVNRVPHIVWEGGAALVTVNVELSGRGLFFVRFRDRQWNEGGGYWYTSRELHGIEELEAGAHRFVMEVPAGVHAFFESQLEEAGADASISWQIDVDGEQRWNEQVTWNDALADGFVFGTKVAFDDLATGTIAQVN